MATETEPFDLSLFEELCRSRNLLTLSERANALGVWPSTIARVQTGEIRPGLRLANGCRRLFGLENYVRLFPLTSPEESSHASS